jgi:hypothetical protein
VTGLIHGVLLSSIVDEDLAAQMLPEGWNLERISDVNQSQTSKGFWMKGRFHLFV